jgi:glucose-6-phosphate isomerase
MFEHMNIIQSALSTDLATGRVHGSGVQRAERRIGELAGVFADVQAWARLDPQRLAYATECVFPVPEGRAGGLFWGTTLLEPGLVGDEYMMTKGHFHAFGDRTEVYLTYAGEGLLLLMDRQRKCWAERMRPGSTHCIPPDTAHRTINTGDGVLSFGACWPSDAGHDYDSIAAHGFAVRVRRCDGQPHLVPA